MRVGVHVEQGGAGGGAARRLPWGPPGPADRQEIKRSFQIKYFYLSKKIELVGYYYWVSSSSVQMI